jgi:ribosomal protein S18 acetylase RimI-like enzyme
MPRQLLPANQFTIDALTNAYNQTRVDYLVPMPFNVARLAEYIKIYNVDMDRSVVATDGEQILGINMLGRRADLSWITRLGVLPVRRRKGTGEAMMRYLLEKSDELGHPHCVLEVIKNNAPAYQLFKKLKFYETRELLILRRAPNGPMTPPKGDLVWFSSHQALDVLARYPNNLPWLNQIETFQQSDDTLGLRCKLPNGDCGWLVFRKQKFYLTHLVLHTEQGDPIRVAKALLTYLHLRYPIQDTHTENIPLDDPHLPAFWDLGYFEVFRRIEMCRDL